MHQLDSGSGFRLSERLFLAVCRPFDKPDYPGGTARTTIDNALEFLEWSVPGFLEMVRQRKVLDFGCGHGWQATALARKCDATVTGLDLARPVLLASWEKIRQDYKLPNLTLTTTLPETEMFDLTYSCSSFEHFSDPEEILSLMRERTKIGGYVVISFAEPWYSPYGSHMNGLTLLPWVNLLFSERTVMRVRALYRNDAATRYEDIEGGLNRMTVARFERLMFNSGMRVERLNRWPVKRIPLVTNVPVLRELLTTAMSCVLKRVE
jgi:2-polyprenyl-3-methyl-5-hydroxy-6-metoxy-1,4-benzoquinol methylase